jgi:hypothetical protein
MPLAVEQIRRMRGGAQSHLMRCAAEDNEYYVVKFQNNPQGVKILANELLGTRLAARIGLPVPAAAVVEVRRELIDQTDDLVMQLGRGRAPCRAGFQFGSRYPGRPQETVVYDFLPEEHLRSVSNLADFCGMLVFDKWTCNTNGRQAIFLCSAEGAPYRTQMSYGAQMPYRAQMIDQGFCFNAGEWSFPDAPLRGLYARHCVYESVRGMEAFEPWIARVESLDASDCEEAACEIPPDWYNGEQDALFALLERLLARRTMVRNLIISAWKSTAQPFPNWT